MRLSKTSVPPLEVEATSYPRSTRSGIVHLGVGAFHKAHQAVYTDLAMEEAGGDWMIQGVSLRSPDVAEAINPQDGLYTLLTREPTRVTARIVRSIANVLVAASDPKAVIAAMTSAETRIVSLTITEKGYGLDPKTGGLDTSHPAIADDIATPGNPQSAVAFIVKALRLRRERGIQPFTVLCCDNLPSNGKVVRRLVVEFARLRDAALASFIEEKVPFPSTMVDRITPASTEKTYADAARLTGFEDRAAVETEPFVQWIVEDDFVSGRPDWETAGAIFVEDVAPYEKMKLRMLNGAHSMLAYAGFIAGHKFVRDVMKDADLAVLIARHHEEASRTLDPVPGIDLEAYGEELRQRFANPNIEHQTYQIAMDGTQKLPQRLIEPAMVALERGFSLDAYAFAVAAWMRYALGRGENGETYALRDPREAEIAAAVADVSDAATIAARLHALPGLFPEALQEADFWRQNVVRRLDEMLKSSMRAAIADEAIECRA
jgi:fructuronate reductase